MRLTIRILLIATAVLIISLRVSKRLNSKSSGFYVLLPGHVSRSECGDFSLIVLQISKEHSFRINSETVSTESLRGRLREIYRLRAERVLLVSADPDVSFQEVVGAMDIAQGAVTNLYLVLVTPEEEKEPCLFIKRPPQPKLPGLPQ
jgi:biopolymer transport protein ExbD